MPLSSAADRQTVPPGLGAPWPGSPARSPIERGARAEIGGIEQLFGRHPHVIAVGDVVVEVGERELHGLQHDVQRLRAVDGMRADAERLQHAEAGERGDALAVRRQLVHDGAGERRGDGVDPIGLVAPEVVEAHHAAVRRRMRDHGVGERALVERLATALDDQFQAAGVRLLAHEFAGFRRAAAREEMLGEARLVAQQLAALAPQFGDHRRQHEAVAGVADRRLGERGERQGAVALRERDPGGDRARHGDGVPAALRHRLVTLEIVGRPTGGRAARCVEALQLRAVPDDGEAVAAEPVAGRLDQRQHHGGGDDGVDRVAAAPHHLQPGLRRERLRGGNHVAAHHRRSGGGIGAAEIQIVDHGDDP